MEISRNWVVKGANALALASAAACLYSMRRADPDLWGYLSAGRLFVEQGGVTTHDPFAYTSTGLQWVPFENVAQIALWLAYHHGGPSGLIALKCLVGGAALYFLFVAFRATTDDPYFWLPLFLLCASALSRFFLFRPQLFTFAYFALFVAVLFRSLLGRRAHLWMLPIVMLAWANTHGGFVAGLGAVGLAILLRASGNIATGPFRPEKTLSGTAALWLVLAACLAATFVNPLGWRLWGYVLTELTHSTNREYIAEWGPPSLRVDPWSAVALTVLTAALAVMVWFVRRRGGSRGTAQAVYWALSCVPLIAMAWVSIRHLPLAAIWTGPVIALLGATTSVREHSAFRRVWFAFTGVALLPVALTFAVVYVQPRPLVSADRSVFGGTHPCGAMAFLRAHHLAGHVYNPLWWGSYLTWELYPAIRVSMDGRNISLFRDEMVKENLEFYSDRCTSLEAPLQYDTDFLLIPTNQQVLTAILDDDRWRQIYRDDDSVLFARAGAQYPSPPPSAPGALPDVCSAMFE